jgi:hypothetical protein
VSARIRALWGIGLALLVGFAVVGVVLSAALAAAVYWVIAVGEVIEEGERAAEGKTDGECVAFALERAPEERWLVPESTFFAHCLAYADATEALCAGVPEEFDEAAVETWSAVRCGDAEARARCESLMNALHGHCATRPAPR